MNEQTTKISRKHAESIQHIVIGWELKHYSGSIVEPACAAIPERWHLHAKLPDIPPNSIFLMPRSAQRAPVTKEEAVAS
jgi:predicted oxidoreductase (fatty acid repression mutant protein)